jgi:prepilin-type N-terminal cleavage/methylation domain-containing protein
MRLFYTTRGRFGRPAFTLIELIVVITIIAILVSLSAAATIRFIGVQQRSNTQTTINKVYDRVNTSYKAYRDQFDPRDTIPSAIHDYILTNLANPNDPNAESRARVIYIKMRYKQVFPMNFKEALNPFPLPPLPTYQAYLSKLGVTASTGAAYESSACLLMALSQAQGGGGVNAEALAGGSSVASFALPSGQSIQAFVDAWGTPLTFARWPTGCTLLNPNGLPKSGFNDPGDPQGYLANFVNGWVTSSYAANYRTLLHNLPTSSPTGTPLSYKLVPMIVSAGPDRKLGLDVITPLTNNSTLATLSHDADDNIYSTTAP